mmetsp:Transcript_43405/g.86076  ORF Transcript_43405/g.86076 Transcript_43405/m.86076 type:complete len:331 (+) Transcript_43405:51-1043(+)
MVTSRSPPAQASSSSTSAPSAPSAPHAPSAAGVASLAPKCAYASVGPLGSALRAQLQKTQAAIAKELKETDDKLRAARAEATQADNEHETAQRTTQRELQARNDELQGMQARLREALQDAEDTRARETELAERAEELRASLVEAESNQAAIDGMRAREADLQLEVEGAQSRLQMALFDAESAMANKQALEAKLEETITDFAAARNEHGLQLQAKGLELEQTKAQLEAALADVEHLRVREEEMKEQRDKLAEREATLRAELGKGQSTSAKPKQGRSKSKKRGHSKHRGSVDSGLNFGNALNALRMTSGGSGSSSATARRRAVSRGRSNASK